MNTFKRLLAALGVAALLGGGFAMPLAGCAALSEKVEQIPTETPEQKLAVAKVTYASALNTLIGVVDAGLLSDDTIVEIGKSTDEIDRLIAEADALIAADAGFDLLETKVTAIKVLVESLAALVGKYAT